MRRNLIIYSILLLSLAGVFLFLSSNYIDSSNQEFEDDPVQNLIQEEKVKLMKDFIEENKSKFSSEGLLFSSKLKK